jgi:hypothetical protein
MSRRLKWERLFLRVFLGAHTNSHLITLLLRERSGALQSAPVAIKSRYCTMRAGEDQDKFNLSGINTLMRFASLTVSLYPHCLNTLVDIKGRNSQDLVHPV